MDSNRKKQLEDLAGEMKSISHVVAVSSTKDDLNYLAERLSFLLATASEIPNEHKILNSLYFESINNRHSKIPQAYADTFDWMLRLESQDTGNQRVDINFVEWLQSQNGVYWISGKAGSGKSTLMKYLCDHPRTQKDLLKWAANAEMVSASYFFWNSGTNLQKSQEGLLRSLLFDVLRKLPNLIPVVCPDRWERTERFSANRRPWDMKELYQTIQRLIDQSRMLLKFCFFIDGLDEYEGHHHEIIEVINLLISSGNIKICLSSRPWNVFEDAYGRGSTWKLSLQDLTRGDIELYVRNKLEEHPNFASLILEDGRYQDLIHDIVRRSQGVFLWVFLVVRSLYEGLTNGDRVQTLQARLQRLPTDLEPFFKHMLTQVDEFYQEEMCRTFQLALKATGPLPLMAYSFLDEPDPDFAIKIVNRPFNNREIDIRHSKMRRRLNGCCKGLLEVSLDPSANAFWSTRVDWLHRTVRDWMLTSDMRSMLASNVGVSFNANRSLCRAYLALFKTGDRHVMLPDELYALMYHARQGELETLASDTETLHHIEKIIEELSRIHKFPVIPEATGYDRYASFFDFAIAHGLKIYVAETIDQKPFLTNRPILHTALHPHEGMELAAMVKILLERGADPNQSYRGSTVWGIWLIEDCKRQSSKNGHKEDFLQTLEILLHYKADPNRPYFEGTTIWLALLNWMSSPGSSGVQSDVNFQYEILHKLLYHGADPYVGSEIQLPGRALTSILSQLPHRQSAQLWEEIRSKQEKRRRRHCICNPITWLFRQLDDQDIRRPLLS